MDTIVQTRRSLQQRLCCLCSFEAPTIAQLLSHLRLVHSSDPRFSVQCGINGCTVTCKSFPSLYSHVYRHHPDAGIRKRKTANHLMELRDFTSEPTTSSDNHELTPSLLLSDSTGIEVHIPYSGKIWRGINFGGLANLSKGRQIKNSPIFSSCACVSVFVHFVRA